MTYRITDYAIDDLKGIAHYTAKTWGIDAVQEYIPGLWSKLAAIGRGAVVKEHYRGEIPNLFVTRFRHHQIFYFDEEGEIPGIVRILHDRQDRVRHLKKSVSTLNWVKGDKPIDL